MHVCLFDIDGTLISSGGAGKAALEAGMASAFGVDRLIDKLQLSGRTDRAIIRDLFKMQGIAETEENLHRLTQAYLGHLPASLRERQGKVLPGIDRVVRHLAERSDVALGLLTGNIRAGARVKLGYFRLFDYFRFGGFGDDHFDRDDVAREALTAVEQHLQQSVDLDRVWVVGDTPLDVRCARAIGARAVAVATGWHSVEELQETRPDLLLNDLSDADGFLSQLT